MTKTKRPTPVKLTARHPCGANLKGHYGTCERPGQVKYAGRCSSHRMLSEEERAAIRAARLAKYEAEEAAYAESRRLADLASARDHFTSAALFFGLASSETAVAFERFQRLSGDGE